MVIWNNLELIKWIDWREIGVLELCGTSITNLLPRSWKLPRVPPGARAGGQLGRNQWPGLWPELARDRYHHKLIPALLAITLNFPKTCQLPIVIDCFCICWSSNDWWMMRQGLSWRYYKNAQITTIINMWGGCSLKSEVNFLNMPDIMRTTRALIIHVSWPGGHWFPEYSV